MEKKNITLDNVKEINKQIDVETILEMRDLSIHTGGRKKKSLTDWGV